jgi:hypothetical protein
MLIGGELGWIMTGDDNVLASETYVAHGAIPEFNILFP